MSHNHRPVPQIGRGPQQFSPAGQAAEQTSEDDMAMEIFVRVVAAHLTAGRVPDYHQTAKHCMIAARAYFQATATGLNTDAKEISSQ